MIHVPQLPDDNFSRVAESEEIERRIVVDGKSNACRWIDNRFPVKAK